MSLWKVAWRSIQQRSLASTLTAVSMGLGVALVVAVLVIYGVVHRAFHRGGEGYDLVIGPKGGRLELVLSSVYYLGEPIADTLPYDYYQQFVSGRFVGDVETAVPVCLGHSYRGYRVVGTSPAMFDELTYHGGKKYRIEGRNFKADAPFEAVVGSVAARDTGLKVGSTFQATHGSRDEGGRVHKQPFTVVGLLERSGTPNDRAVFVNMEGFYLAHHAEHADHPGSHSGHSHGQTVDPVPPEEKAVSSILVCIDPEKPGTRRVLPHRINDGSTAQAVAPVVVIAELFEGIVGDVQWLLLALAMLVVLVAGLGIMVSIYNSMSERGHEIAVMRALGASRATVMLVVLFESILLSLGGGALGLLLGHGLIGALSPIIVERTQVAVGLLSFRPAELFLIPGLIALATVVGYLPALTAYRTDVARWLTNTP